ncbi:MAG: excinuclease ABC subunit UvrB [Bacteroidetes bacterium]|nr:excinuclease ABC subunit UvrB [Bacteroidota bacterium]MCB0842266.1 excinuclease ABC subunit UvrB [Bacteroidota bacterium]
MSENKFELVSPYKPSGDQPQAIQQLMDGINSGERHQVLLGVTGSGKTFTMANVIKELNRPTLIISHNKTLAAQLYGEFKEFFPHNLVEYFISYYDYYQPEAYIPSTNTYIEKDLQINQDIEKLRLRSTTALSMNRRDVVVVASVSCIYGIGRPEDFEANIFYSNVGLQISQNMFLDKLVRLFYSRTQGVMEPGKFRVRGDTVDVYPAYDDFGIRFIFFGDEIETIQRFEIESGKKIEDLRDYTMYPANLFVTRRETVNESIKEIQDDLVKQIEYFEAQGMFLEANRLKERTEYDLEMMRELGYCSGIENYSRYLSKRDPGSRPYCLIDYFPDDFLLIIDESHVTIPQIRAMYHGDRSRKFTLVEHGFRLPSALDNRPQKFEEFNSLINQVVYLSATPSDYELEKSDGIVVEQIVRPTGLLDPPCDVRPCGNQVDDLLEEVDEEVKKGNRVLVTTLTKRMSEELTKYLGDLGIRTRYIHSDIDSLERVDILRDLREGKFDVLVGVNLLREGLDLPEVALVAILDADKEGFLRSAQSLIQTAGRAARHQDGRVILYADKITKSMKRLLDETEYRREKQLAYNKEHGIIPKTVTKAKKDIFQDALGSRAKTIEEFEENVNIAAEAVAEYMTEDELKQKVAKIRKEMETAAKELNFIEAARLRDEMFAFQSLLKEKRY